MNMNHHTTRTMLRSATVAAAALFAAPVAGDNLAELAQLAQAQGEQYVTLRNTLLEQHPEPWDIPTATAQSWEFGLAAYILNQRSKEKEAFKTLDNARPAHYRDVEGYKGLSRSPEANMAFLLEKMWKAPSEQDDRRWPVTPEQDRQYAYNTLVQRGRYADVGETALWKSMWEESEDDRFRFIALRAVCADPDPSVQPIIAEVLHSDDNESAPYSKSRCLSGLVYNDSTRAKDLVLENWEQLVRVSHKEAAIGVLSTSPSPRARELLYSVALDRHESIMMRHGTIAKLSNLPLPSDPSFLNKFLTEVESGKLKRKVVGDLAKWFPLEWYGATVREILTESDDPKMVGRAAFALSSAYDSAKEVDELAKAADAALLEDVLRTREDLASDTRVHIQMYIEGLRAKPGDPRPQLPGASPRGR